MHAGRVSQGTTTIAAACLLVGLLVAGCTTAPSGSADPAPLPTVSVTPRTPSPSTVPTAPTPAASEPAPSVPPPTSSGTPSVAVPAAPPSPAAPTPAPSSTPSEAPQTQPATVVEPSPRPGTSAPEPTATPTVIPVDAGSFGPAVYYVAIDDGGARGVRFGCNDSLVPVRGVAVPGDPLSVALGRLLESGMPVDSDAALYDALANSSLRYLSGYMSGATVVVNLSGSLRPGGVCDIPRIQAQLTQTIVQASGASRAEIYVNGRTLTEALSVR
ncbi:GerMN domain-containing protein [Arthrobacter sp. ISL-95]|uniref:GerMN domain-containing protein n=1 Tax=Arthrobacter sp. ISL-95 TaxID=2819116 RepID=UPI001BE5A1BA|nr:GerMN domain-containing protein [Arthrobacter sp. ISL-95]MBT2587801.1 GerMN domain-containing protein [Arthrobacter sp. ISL-95]